MHALRDDLLDPFKGAADDEQDIFRVDSHDFALRMLAATLERNIDDASFKDLQERLLHCFIARICRRRQILAFARDLIDLVDIDDTALCFLDVSVCYLQETLETDFRILTYINSIIVSAFYPIPLELTLILIRDTASHFWSSLAYLFTSNKYVAYVERPRGDIISFQSLCVAPGYSSYNLRSLIRPIAFPALFRSLCS